MVAVEDGDVGAEGAEVAGAGPVGHFEGEGVGGDGVAGGEDGDGGVAAVVFDVGDAAEERDIGEGHLGGAVGGDGDADVGADEFECGAGDDGHFDLVEGAGEEFAEGGAEGDFAGGGTAGGDGDHVLFGDAAFEEVRRVVLVEVFGVGGIFDVGVEGDDVGVGVAKGGEGEAEGAAGGEFLFDGEGFGEACVFRRTRRCRRGGGRGVVMGGGEGWVNAEVAFEVCGLDFVDAEVGGSNT